ncbi:hypothetical protein CTEN210_07851 [Chaetoceros tenuissimus]|uniref:Uncharacterized protein n=1 Tax=Chaetoceros tenuissimus TaxID=426638 RepID=A0AAD3CUY2_9STRA|nr:hypothetical protein CTEN210_07851 [Chaetoceros tenuissimus]
MTIKIEREALQCITNDVPICSPLDESINQVDRIPEARCKEDQLPFPEMELTDDDDSSVSSYSFSSASSGERRVSWSDSLVTDIRTRERTRPEDVSLLFYSYEETQRFRQEYRLERRKAAEEAANVQCTQLSNEKASIFPDSSSAWSSSNIVDNCAANPSAGRHRISRVVIMHKNSFETFVDKDIFSAPSPHDNKATVSNSASDDFFDNDSFWSGQITWY